MEESLAIWREAATWIKKVSCYRLGYGVDLPFLRSSRLLLRPLLESDVQALFELDSDPEVSRYNLWETHQNLKDTLAYIAEARARLERWEALEWGVELNGQLVGTVGLYSLDFNKGLAEIGYSLGRTYWGKGIATEAAQTAITFGIEVLSLREIWAESVEKNTASARVLEKLGFKLYATLYDAPIKEEKHVLRQYRLAAFSPGATAR